MYQNYQFFFIFYALKLHFIIITIIIFLSSYFNLYSYVRICNEYIYFCIEV